MAAHFRSERSTTMRTLRRPAEFPGYEKPSSSRVGPRLNPRPEAKRQVYQVISSYCSIDGISLTGTSVHLGLVLFKNRYSCFWKGISVAQGHLILKRDFFMTGRCRSDPSTSDYKYNDVKLRQHDINCFENNFLQTKYWPAVGVSKCPHSVRRICRASVSPIMGNCLKGSGQDDISLLHDEESVDSPTTGEPPPPYQVEKPSHIMPYSARLITFMLISSHLWRFLL